MQTGKRHGGRFSSMFLSNFFVGFPSEKQTEDTYNKMTAYWERAGIEIIDDGSEIEAEGGQSSIEDNYLER